MPNSNPPEVIEVLRLAPGGEGVARRPCGEVMFIAGTAPGEYVEVAPLLRSHGVSRGKLLRVLRPSPDRRTAPCSYADRCGGCDFMHLTLQAQRRFKLALLEDALMRVGGSPPRPAQTEVVSDGAELGYRARLRLHVDRDGRVGFLSARSHRIVPVDRCLVASPAIDAAITQLAGCDPKDRRRLSFCEQVELRSAPSAPELAVRLFPRKGVQLNATLYLPLFPPGASVVVAGATEDHEQTQSVPIAPELALRIPFSAFSQIHQHLNRELVRRVVAAATLRNHQTFLDAYAGAGNFALPLLRLGLTGEALDTAGPGILAARTAARDLGLPFDGFTIGDAKQTLVRFAQMRRRFDFIVLDPPRQGAKTVLEATLALRPRTLALIGSEPVALARDLGTLHRQGATIETLTMFDMFPQTHHFETLAIVHFNA